MELNNTLLAALVASAVTIAITLLGFAIAWRKDLRRRAKHRALLRAEVDRIRKKWPARHDSDPATLEPRVGKKTLALHGWVRSTIPDAAEYDADVVRLFMNLDGIGKELAACTERYKRIKFRIQTADVDKIAPELEDLSDAQAWKKRYGRLAKEGTRVLDLLDLALQPPRVQKWIISMRRRRLAKGLLELKRERATKAAGNTGDST